MYGYVSKKNVIKYRFTVNNYCEPAKDLSCTSTFMIVYHKREKSVYEECYSIARSIV